MKVLLVNKFYYLKGGSERHLFELKNVLEKNNHEVIIFSTDNEKNSVTGKNEYFIKEVRMDVRNFLNGCKLFYNRQAVKELKKIIAKEHPDIAHLHNISHHFSPAILKVFKKNNIPVVMTVHDYKLICPNYKLFNHNKICEKCLGGKFYHCALDKCVKRSYLGSLVMTLEAYWAKWRKYYENIDVLIAPSQFMKNKLIENGFNHKQIRHIPNFLRAIDENQSIESDSNRDRYILFFGRLSGEKGIDDLIKAFSRIDDQDLILKIAGDGEEMETLKKMSEKMGIAERVHFLGYQAKDLIVELIRNSELVVVPSTWYENAPYSVLESYEQKKAVIGSRLGGISELIKNDETGATFTAGDIDNLAKKINHLLRDRQKAAIMGEKGFQFLRDKFNQDVYYKKLMSLYQELIDSKKVDKNRFK